MNEGKNYICNVLWMVLAVVVLLVAAHWLPDVNIAGTDMRRVDILADVIGTDSEETEEEVVEEVAMDSIAADPSREEDTEPCPPGVTKIDDYSTDGRGMQPFYAALTNRAMYDRPVRIAVLGDSYIEGDILTANLREMLQSEYGGCGVGFVPVTSETNGFRRSVIHKFGGWKSYSMTGKKNYDSTVGIMSGYYSVPDSAAWVRLTGQTHGYSHLDSCQQSTIYFLSRDINTVRASIDRGTDVRMFDVFPSEEIQSLTVSGNIHNIRWSSGSNGRNFIFYGVTQDCTSGVILDNYSLRGSSGFQLLNVRDERLRQFHEQRPYDLVIMIYGMNVLSGKQKNYGGYKQNMVKTLEKLKRCMPGTGFLLVSVGDKAERKDGDFHTIPAVRRLVRSQQAAAAESGVAFWNMYDAMGGEGSIIKMVNSKPSEANLDYTHINFRGGKKIAKALFDAMQYGMECYDKQNAQEEGGLYR